jgi:hypothetical protein
MTINPLGGVARVAVFTPRLRVDEDSILFRSVALAFPYA